MEERIKRQMQLLVEQATRAVIVYCNRETNRFLLLPIEDEGSTAFTSAVRESAKNGFKPLSLIALCFTQDGAPLIEDEAMPGASDDDRQAAKQLFINDLVEDGLLKPSLPIN